MPMPMPPGMAKKMADKKKKMPKAGNMAARGLGNKAAPKPKDKGMDPGKFMGEVGDNARKFAGEVGRNLDNAIGSRGASKSVPDTLKNAPANRAALKKALGK